LFANLHYRVSPITLPTGQRIGPQTFTLDPYHVSSIHVKIATDAVTRNFHWILRATNALYDGSHDLSLLDAGKSVGKQLRHLYGNRYSITIVTHWKAQINLKSFSVSGYPQPAGMVAARALFHGTYVLVFSE
jgi:hypothetical protein